MDRGLTDRACVCAGDGRPPDPQRACVGQSAYWYAQQLAAAICVDQFGAVWLWISFLSKRLASIGAVCARYELVGCGWHAGGLFVFRCGDVFAIVVAAGHGGGVLRSRRDDCHADFAWALFGGQSQRPYLASDSKTGRLTAQNCTGKTRRCQHRHCD